MCRRISNPRLRDGRVRCLPVSGLQRLLLLQLSSRVLRGLPWVQVQGRVHVLRCLQGSRCRPACVSAVHVLQDVCSAGGRDGVRGGRVCCCRLC
jgi:hypothetical protein